MADAAEDWSVWLYEPSLPLAIVGTIMYAAVFVWITYLTAFKYRSWYFVCVPIGASLEVVGYAMRCHSTQDHQNIVSWPGNSLRLAGISWELKLTGLLCRVCSRQALL